MSVRPIMEGVLDLVLTLWAHSIVPVHMAMCLVAMTSHAMVCI